MTRFIYGKVAVKILVIAWSLKLSSGELSLIFMWVTTEEEQVLKAV